MHKKDIPDDSRWKATSSKTNAEMARPGERGYGQNQMTTEMADDRKHWHGMIQAGTLRNVEAGR